MGILALGQAEAGLEVLREVFGFLNGSDDSFVNLLLVQRFRFRKRLLWLWLAILEELSLC